MTRARLSVTRSPTVRHAGRVAAAVALVVVARSLAPAAPVVTVRSRADIELEPLRRTGDGVEVAGRVVDRATGDGVSFVVVDVRLDDRRTPVLTGEDGGFAASFAVSGGPWDIGVTFPGTEHYSGAERDLSAVRARLQPLALDLDVPPEVAVGDDTVQIAVNAASRGRPASLGAEILAGPAGGELERAARVRIARGRGSAAVPVAALGGPGRVTVRAAFGGSESYRAAEAESSILVTAATELELALAEAEVGYGDDVEVSGRLADRQGRGIAGEIVQVTARGRPIAQAATGDEGTFSADIAAADLGEGTAALQATCAPAGEALGFSRSAPVTVSVAAPEPVPLGYTLAAFGASVLVLGAFVAGRTRPWSAWSGLRRQEQARAPDRDAAPAPPAGGLREARPGLVSALRRAHDRGITGVVEDAATGAPIPGAAVVLAGPAPEPTELVADTAGAFGAEDLADGSWRVEVTAPGYIAESFTCACPHRGELRGARVAMVPVRERIFALYAAAARPLFPAPDLVAVWTPRQIVDHVRRARPADALASLTSYVEETLFSPRAPGERELEEAERRAGAVRREAGERPVGGA